MGIALHCILTKSVVGVRFSYGKSTILTLQRELQYSFNQTRYIFL